MFWTVNLLKINQIFATKSIKKWCMHKYDFEPGPASSEGNGCFIKSFFSRLGFGVGQSQSSFELVAINSQHFFQKSMDAICWITTVVTIPLTKKVLSRNKLALWRHSVMRRHKNSIHTQLSSFQQESTSIGDADQTRDEEQCYLWDFPKMRGIGAERI